MTQDQAMALNAAGAYNYSGISVPGDSIFDNIFDWIANIIPSTLDAIGDNVVKVINAIGDNQVKVINAISSGSVQVITAAAAGFASVISNITTGTTQVINAIGSNIALVTTAITTSINSVLYNAGVVLNSTILSIADGTSQVIAATATGLSSVITNIADGTSQVIAATATGFASVTASVGQLVGSISQTIVSTFSSLSAQVQANFTWITTWLSTSIPKILGSWWDLFVGKIFNFVDWVPKLLDTVSAWVTRDIPGHSPWWHTVIETLFPQFRMFFFTKPGEQYKGVGQSITDTITVSLGWLGGMFNTVVDGFLTQVEAFIEPLGPMDPSHGLANFQSLSKVGGVALGALAGMTLAGSWLKPLGEQGMGHIAAMIYDMTNYKLITAAFMGALVTAVLAKPLRYYYAWKFRPDIPSIRDLSDMLTDEFIQRPEFDEYLKYHGIPDYWHEGYASIAYRAMSPFQLKSAAQDGSFDEGIFSRELTHAGFRPETKKMLLDSFRKAAASNVQTYSVSGATGRFKTGWTNEDQFTSELQILRVNPDMIPVYLAMTKLDFATGYLNDMATAYVNAVRSGQIGIDDYRQALLNLGMVPQRVEAKVFIEQARIKPSGALSPVALPKPLYLTEYGKLVMDTIRLQRKMGVRTSQEEQAGLIALGMEQDLAMAYSAYDDAQVAAASIPPPTITLSKYETPAGKISIDTTRRQARANTLSHEQEVAALVALDMPVELAEEYSNNDDTRRKATATTTGG